MALVSTPGLYFPQPLFSSAVGPAGLIDAADEMAYGVYIAPKTGNIRNIHFRTGTVTTGGTGDIDIRIETVNTSGEPSGTLWGTNTNIAYNLLDTDDNSTIRTANLTASAAVNKGDPFAVVLKNPTVNFGNFNILKGFSGLDAVVGFPFAGGPLSTNKTDQRKPPFLIEYDDSTIYNPTGGLVGAFGVVSVTINTGTDPNEVALYFTAPASMRVTGWIAMFTLIAGQSYRISLYESGNNTPLLTNDYDTDLGVGAAGVRIYSAYFSSTYTLVKNTVYRLAVLPLTASSLVLQRLTALSNASFDSLGLPGAQYSTRNRTSTTDPDTAAWTETSTQRLQISLEVDQIDDGTGSGGTVYHHIIGA